MFCHPLFIILLNGVLKRATDAPKGLVHNFNKRLENLEYADDIYLFAHTQSDMQYKLNRLAEEAQKVGLLINTSKTKEMRIGNGNMQPLMLDNKIIDRVDRFTYLGSVVDKNGGTQVDVEARI